MGSGREAKQGHVDRETGRRSDGATTPGRSTLVEQAYGTIQRKASGTATAVPGDAFAIATSGDASAVPYRSQMERAFGRSFGGVEAYLGGAEANQGLDGLGAQAAAHGQQVAFRDASPSPHLVAHELAHVMQQTGGGGGVQCKPSSVSSPGGIA
jgi:Domain of unknown function (DUF4157)